MFLEDPTALPLIDVTVFNTTDWAQFTRIDPSAVEVDTANYVTLAVNWDDTLRVLQLYSSPL